MRPTRNRFRVGRFFASTYGRTMRYHTTTQLSEHIHETPEGYLLCLDVPIARTGVMEYAADEVPGELSEDADGSVVLVSRSAADVFAPETMASFEGKSVTVDHPGEFVTPENWQALTVGICQNVRRGEGDSRDLLLADLLITDAHAIELVRGGLREVSCGYDADYEAMAPGVGRQHNIMGNHIALVPRGRCGARCKINDKDTDMGKPTKSKATDKMPKKPGFWDRLLSRPDVRKAMDEALEEEGKASDEDQEEQPATDADALEQIAASLEEMKLLLRTLVEGKGGTADEDTPTGDEDEPTGDEDEPVADAGEEEETPRPTGDRAPRRKSVQGKAADSDTLRRAAVLAPQLRFRTGDTACTVKRTSLRMAMADAAVRRVVDACLSGQSLDRADCVTLDAAFVAASELGAVGNNRKTADALSRAGARDFGKTVTPADINRMNREFHAKKG